MDGRMQTTHFGVSGCQLDHHCWKSGVEGYSCWAREEVGCIRGERGITPQENRRVGKGKSSLHWRKSGSSLKCKKGKGRVQKWSWIKDEGTFKINGGEEKARGYAQAKIVRVQIAWKIK